MSIIRDPFPPTPAGFHLRVEQTLERLEEKEVKKRGKFAAAIAAALIAALLTATAVAATQYLRGIAHPDGSFEPEEGMLEVATTPKPAPGGDPFAGIPEGASWTFVSESGGRGMRNPWALEDIGALNALLEGSALPAPRLAEGDAAEGISAFTELEAAPREILRLDGGTLYKYGTPRPTAENVEEISLCVRDAEGRGVQYTARRVEASDQADGYSVTGGFEALALPGWDSALHIVNDDGSHSLNLRQSFGDFALEVELSAPGEVPLERLLALAPDAAPERLEAAGS